MIESIANAEGNKQTASKAVEEANKLFYVYMFILFYKYKHTI